MEAALILLDAALVAGLAAWMTVAVADNWRFPEMNEDSVKMVVSFELMAEEAPEHFALVAHRKIDDPKTIRLFFRAIRLAETVAALALWVAAALLALGALGAFSIATATGLAVIASGYFSLIWAGFIIGGNYYCYWYCHPWAQSNHFMFMYWGLFVLVVLLL